MIIEGVPFGVTNWANVPETIHPGATGIARWKTVQAGNVRIRMVSYSANYLADHWCVRGHVVLVLDGVLITEIEDGRVFSLTVGDSYQTSSDVAPHRSSSVNGVRLFIVD